jgi:RNA polymerase sigma factor (sigma-70 family)
MTAEEHELEQLRPASFAIAYRMLGSVSEAEDVVQEALLRVHQAIEDGEQIASPRAYVATVTTRLAINELRSARARREQYVGEWLPEPILTDSADDPAQQAEMADSLSLAMLVLLERLSPEQRAALLLHDVFDYGYPEIAEIIGKSEDNVRQLASRARRHVEEGRPRSQPRRPDAAQLDAGRLAASRFHAAPNRGQRRFGSDGPGRPGAADRRLVAGDRRRRDPRHQLGRQPREARPPRTARGLGIARPRARTAS